MKSLDLMIKKLKGPIIIFGAGGFIGINLLKKILELRNDVIGVSSQKNLSWRIKQNKIPLTNMAVCDLLNKQQVKKLIKKHQPKTIFNLAAYGAYSKQKDIEKIYLTNFNSVFNLIEELKKYGFSVYLQAGSQSEYGLNANQPSEEDELIPNSHYALSKTGAYYLIKYYGQIEGLAVVHLRFYSVYGSWEEPDRLIPTLIRYAKKKKLPPLVSPLISRDFIYIGDLIDGLIQIAIRLKKKDYGQVFNLATGKKTTIKQLIYLAKKLFKINQKPDFSSMADRNWDLKNWVGNPKKIKKAFGWQAKTSLKEGLIKCFNENK